MTNMNNNAIGSQLSPWTQGQLATCEVCGCKIKYWQLTWVHQTGDLQPRHIGWPSKPKQETIHIAPEGSSIAWW